MTLAYGPRREAFLALPGRTLAVLAAERGRWALWLPFFVGTGVAGYFRLPLEPPIWVVPALFSAAIAGALVLRGAGWGLPAGLAIGMVALGFGAAQVRTAALDGPQLTIFS